jgi:hypothetical protein
LRHKAFHIINVHRTLSLVQEIIFSHLTDKLKKRAHLYSGFKDFKAIDPKHLPKEYGGTVPIKELSGKSDSQATVNS